MKRLTIEAIQSQKPREIVTGLIHYSFVESPLLFAQALFNYLLIRVKIIDEFEELLRSPIIMIDEINYQGWTSGDCDDAAMLSASILASAGALTRFRAIEPQPDGSYRHVLCEFSFPRLDNWNVFDLTVGYNQVRIGSDSIVMDIVS